MASDSKVFFVTIIIYLKMIMHQFISPYINIIENLWLKIKGKIEQYVHEIISVESDCVNTYFQVGPISTVRLLKVFIDPSP